MTATTSDNFHRVVREPNLIGCGSLPSDAHRQTVLLPMPKIRAASFAVIKRSGIIHTHLVIGCGLTRVRIKITDNFESGRGALSGRLYHVQSGMPVFRAELPFFALLRQVWTQCVI